MFLLENDTQKKNEHTPMHFSDSTTLWARHTALRLTSRKEMRMKEYRRNKTEKELKRNGHYNNNKYVKA